MNARGIARGEYLHRKNAEDTDRPTVFTLHGRQWDLLANVFSPACTPATGLFTTWLEYPAGGTFLEMGCGAGVTAVTAALSGCRAVTAIDINAFAVENARRNAVRHGVADRVRVLRADLFDGLGRDETFDAIFWNSNFVDAPPDFIDDTGLHHAFFDPGYRAHERYLREGPAHLNPGGRLLLGFSDVGNTALLARLAKECDLEMVLVHAERRLLEQDVEFEIFEFRRAASSAAE
ncbi:methyltransferase [Spongiactinospora sp. 9N601]|uniref:methyltransferase n=1 Tax=Spongiactinospora sp. 9N601 TaxID=3375149 RepID=UPI0037BCF986